MISSPLFHIMNSSHYFELDKEESVRFELEDNNPKKIKLKDVSPEDILVEIEGVEITVPLPLRKGDEVLRNPYVMEQGLRVGAEVTKNWVGTNSYNNINLNLKKDARIYLSDAKLPFTPKKKYTFPTPDLDWDYYNQWLDKVEYGYHFGTDPWGPVGTPVISVTGGKVIAMRRFTPGIDKDDYWGRIISILGDDGIVYYYCHFDTVEPEIKEDALIKKGQSLGTMGTSGFGILRKDIRPHLHFQMWLPRDKKTVFGPISSQYAGFFHADRHDGFTINAYPYMLHWYNELKRNQKNADNY